VGQGQQQGTVIGELEQLTRFNEAIDQAITESVARYTEQVDRSTNLFMGMLGHDIRNPLGTIRLSAELLTRSGKLTPRRPSPSSTRPSASRASSN
jgi:signal transduction histidine kinase